MLSKHSGSKQVHKFSDMIHMIFLTFEIQMAECLPPHFWASKNRRAEVCVRLWGFPIDSSGKRLQKYGGITNRRS